VPSHYAVCLFTSPPEDVARLVPLLPARAEELLGNESWAESEHDVVEALEGGRTKVLGREATYCAKVEADEAWDVAEALPGVDRDRMLRQAESHRVAEGANNWEGTAIGFHPYLPHGEIAFPGR
jgi:hypothetical protein